MASSRKDEAASDKKIKEAAFHNNKEEACCSTVGDEDGSNESQSKQAALVVAQLIANLTHELKTPLHSIIAVAGVLKSKIDGSLSQEQERQVDIILRNGDDLLEMVTNLLDFGSLAGAVRQRRVALVNLSALLARIYETVKTVAERHGVSLKLDLHQLPEEFATDPFLLRQVVANLLSNAVKFSEGGEVCISAEGLAENKIRIQVSDTGIGMSPDIQQRIFNEFYQADDGDTKHFKGVGLGLSLVRSSVDMLNGKLELQSEIKKGTLFTMVLPALNDQLRRRRIWLLNRDSGVRLSIEESLRNEGHVVITFQEPTVVLATQSEELPDLAVLDMSVDSREVIELISKLRKSPWGKKLPIIVLSGYESLDIRQQCQQLGVAHVMTKPFDIDSLLARMRLHWGDEE